MALHPKNVELCLARLKRNIRTIGLYTARRPSHRAVAKADGATRRQGAAHAQELEALPGVGRKTANVVLNAAFGEPTIAVDTHIFRVANRTGLAPGEKPLQVRNAWESDAGGIPAITRIIG